MQSSPSCGKSRNDTLQESFPRFTTALELCFYKDLKVNLMSSLFFFFFFGGGGGGAQVVMGGCDMLPNLQCLA